MNDRMHHEPPGLMDAAEFHDLMSTSFGLEPPHADLTTDLAAGRRQLRRRRAGLGGTALAAIAVVVGAAIAIPALGDEPSAIQPASAPTAVSDAELAARCLGSGNYAVGSNDPGFEADNVAARFVTARFGDAQVMTRATSPNRIVLTVRSADAAYWGDCQLAVQPDTGVKDYMSIYPTAVTFDSHQVDGRPVYEPVNEADPRLEGSATGPMPQFWVPFECTQGQPEETQAWRDAMAGCPTYTVTWNDRRVREVAAARITLPDGDTQWADVAHGYLSFSYSAPMTEEVAEGFRTDEIHSVLDEMGVTFYDQAGEVLVDDRHIGADLPQPGRLTIENYPSVAYWLK